MPVKPKDESGVTLPLLALLMTVLMAMAGFGVDVWQWWFVAQRLQRAADAAALAGAVHMPDDFTTAAAVARDNATRNGYPAAAVAVERGPRPTQLRVTITEAVDNHFIGVLGAESQTIRRTAVGEFNPRVPMGSPENRLGNDPDIGHRVDHWISVSGKGTTKQGGDRHQSADCSEPAFKCPTGGTNPEFDRNGYIFVIRVNDDSARITDDLFIDIYDPAFASMSEQDCGESGGRLDFLPDNATAFGLMRQGIDAQGSTAWSQKAAPSVPPLKESGTDRYVRYRHATYVSSTGKRAAAFCAGDNEDFGTVTTTYTFRYPDATLANDLDNPIVNQPGACVPKQFPAWERTGGVRHWYDLLNPRDTVRDSEALAFNTQFHRWTHVCRIPAATVRSYVNAGTRDFVLQVQANVRKAAGVTNLKNDVTNLADLERTDDMQPGRNHFAIRAGIGGTLGGDVDVFANSRLPIHTAAKGAATEFFLARIGPSHAGGTLLVEFFDVGDADELGTLEIVKPAGSGGGAWTCSFTRDRADGARDIPATDPANPCKLIRVQEAEGYEGSRATATVGVHAQYTCDPTSATGCWVKLRLSYPSGRLISDHTTWSAGMVGDPVRLVE